MTMLRKFINRRRRYEAAKAARFEREKGRRFMALYSADSEHLNKERYEAQFRKRMQHLLIKGYGRFDLPKSEPLPMLPQGTRL